MLLHHLFLNIVDNVNDNNDVDEDDESESESDENDNENNENETDFIPVTFWQAIAENVDEFCGKGSVIGVQCRLSSRFVEKQGVNYRAIDINADRVIFIKTVARNREVEQVNAQ